MTTEIKDEYICSKSYKYLLPKETLEKLFEIDKAQTLPIDTYQGWTLDEWLSVQDDIEVLRIN